MKQKVNTKKDLSTTIFKEEAIQEKANILFNNIKDDFSKQVDEVLKIIREKPKGALSHDNIFSIFKKKFYKVILDEAIEKSLNGENNYNIKDNLLALLTNYDNSLKKSTQNELLISAISTAILSIPVTSNLETCIYNSKIDLLKQKYSNNI